MRLLYSALLYLLTPYLFLRLWIKGKRLPAYKARVMERFALVRQKPVDVWLHAVSLGEVIAATPLIEAFLNKNWSVLVTTMTPTGSERVLKRFGSEVSHCYIPYDLPGAFNRFFSQTQPKIGIIMETELWPNMVHQAHLKNIPLLLVNGRLSQGSFSGYLKLKWFIKTIVREFTEVLVQTEEDANRFIALGAPKDRVFVFGNMKFDIKSHEVDLHVVRELKKSWGSGRVVIIAASTHEDEEAQIVQHLQIVQQGIPGALLLIAPRHPERFQSVYQFCLQSGLNTGLRSDPDSINSSNEVIILDSLGELLGFYKMSDYAFVGGSLVAVGGHNVLEPIAMGIPVLSGVYVHNFKSICEDLSAAHAIRMVQDAKELMQAVLELHENQEDRHLMIQRASSVLENNRGAVANYLMRVERFIPKGPSESRP